MVSHQYEVTPPGGDGTRRGRQVHLCSAPPGREQQQEAPKRQRGRAEEARLHLATCLIARKAILAARVWTASGVPSASRSSSMQAAGVPRRRKTPMARTSRKIDGSPTKQLSRGRSKRVKRTRTSIDREPARAFRRAV